MGKPSLKQPTDVCLLLECQAGKNENMLQRLLKKKANVNYKSPEDGVTPIYLAACNGSASFVRLLTKANADPKVPSTPNMLTPLDAVDIIISQRRDYDETCNNFEAVNRLDDIYTAIRPDLKPLEAVKAALLEEGAVGRAQINGEDGSINGGAATSVCGDFAVPQARKRADLSTSDAAWRSTAGLCTVP